MINWARVNELKCDIGEENIGEIVEIFLEEVEGVLDELRQGPDRTKVKCAAHFLKGSALNLGFERLGAVCSKGESLNKEKAETDTLVADILSVYEASKSEFMHGLCR